MIIFNIVDEIEDTKSYFRGLMRGKFNNISRDFVHICNMRLDVISLSYKSLESESIKRLLDINKGKILESTDARLNETVREYLYDKTPYVKKALLSSVNKFIAQTGEHLSVVVFDKEFVACEEYFALANSIKRLSLVLSEASSISSFADKVYYDYGLKVSLKQRVGYSDCDVAVDFSRLEGDGCLKIFYRGESIALYPDNKYFEPDKDVLDLMSYGVPIRCACAIIRGKNYLT